MKSLRVLLGGLVLAAGFSPALYAQTYPSGPIRVIVPYPPGGGTDILARQIGQKLNEAWSVPVLIDNRGGASGTIGTALAAKAAPDGQTLLVVPSGASIAAADGSSGAAARPNSPILSGGGGVGFGFFGVLFLLLLFCDGKCVRAR